MISTEYLAHLLVILQLADLGTTHYALKTGLGREANPVMRKLFDRFGHEPVLLVVKGALIALLLWGAPLVPIEVLWLIVALYVWVVGNNLYVIYRARQNKEN
jgi:hypothetical protein